MTKELETTFTCAECGQVKPVNHDGGTGYGYDKSNRKICYACCGLKDAKEMKETGRATLYLAHHKDGTTHGNFALGCQPEKPTWTVTNWPGTLSFSAWVKKGYHNIAGTRYDAWFTGPDGAMWHGVNYGENSQICHCKRTKTKN